MLKTLRGLPVRIPAEEAVRGVLSRGGNYRVNAREHKAFEVYLDRVLFSRADGHAMERVPEERIAELLTLVVLAKSGDRYQHESNVGRSDEEIAADPSVMDLHLSVRAARVLARVLAVRALMRTELGMS